MAVIDDAALYAYVGQPITQICNNHYSPPGANHCAHFVSHALGLQLGTLCGDMSWKTRHTGASIRCDELYNRLQLRGNWGDLRSCYRDAVLIFVTSARNVQNNLMNTRPMKHVGIYANGKVYNYSNTQHRVVVDSSVTAFHEKFKQAYRKDGDDISLFYGVTP